MANAEPVALLRAVVKTGVVIDGDELVFSDSGLRFPRSTPSSYGSLRGRGAPYALEALWGLKQWGDKPRGEYVNACLSARVPTVQIVDVRDLLAFLSGDDGAGTAQSLADNTTVPTEVAEGEMQSLAQYERPQRTRDSVMTVPGRSFKPILDALNHHIERKRKLEARMRMSGFPSSSVNPGENGAPKYDPRGDRYRVSEDTFYKENMGTDFSGIDTAGSFKVTAQQIIEKEQARKEPRTEKIAADEPREKESSGDIADRRPIIIVPSGFSVFVGIHNAPELLFQGKFIEERAAKELQPRNARVGSIVTAKRSNPLVKRQSVGTGGNYPSYLLVNNPGKLSEREWKRVIAVVVSGQNWQFKDFGSCRAPADVQRRFPCFFFHYDDDRKILESIKDWKVTRLAVSRNKRHLDANVAVQFWQGLDPHLLRKHSSLQF